MSSTLTIHRIEHLQDIIDLQEIPEEISNPLFRVIATALSEKRVDGDWYFVRDDPEVQDFKFAFLGFNGKPQLHLEGLWRKSCRECGQAMPVLILRRTLHLRSLVPNRIEQYEKSTESLVSHFTIEGGKGYFDGFLTIKDLMRGNHSHGKTPPVQKRGFSQ